MIIYPAIDLRQGRCVRLRQGDPNAETVFGDDPAAMARHWVAQGAEWLHVVNLDGALGATQAQIHALHRAPSVLVQHIGSTAPESPEDELKRLPINLRRLREIRAAVSVPIQFGGGLRTLDDIRLALELGADRVVLGTVAIERPALVVEALQQWGANRIVVGIDARDGKAATHGWQTTSQVDAVELGHRMQALGITHVVYTDISRDGMLNGINLAATSRLGDVTGLKVIASGGVGGLDHLQQLKQVEHYNIDGVIIGQALYTNRVDLPSAIELGHQELTRRSAGIVPFRRGPDGVQFLLLYNWFFEQWQFPRGAVTQGESDLDAAQRELTEATGLSLRHLYDATRTELQYTATIRGYAIKRTIVYYAGEVNDGDVALGSTNHCEVRWADARAIWESLTETSPEQLPAFDAALAQVTRLGAGTKDENER